MFSTSTCQTVSTLAGIGVLILDLTSLGLSVTGAILELAGAAAGPEGLAAAIATYADTLNPIENALGVASGVISTANDVLVTGETYARGTRIQGTPALEVVLGSDTSVAVVTTGFGFSPEAVTDSLINVGAIAYDAYRLSGGGQILNTHIILTANGNLHFGFSFPSANGP